MSGLTLTELIGWLGDQDPNAVVPHGFGTPESYRGKYSDVAFARAQDVLIGDMLAHAKSAMGRTFEGYKGGEHTMGEETECWISRPGSDYSDKIGPTILSLWEMYSRKDK